MGLPSVIYYIYYNLELDLFHSVKVEEEKKCIYIRTLLQAI